MLKDHLQPEYSEIVGSAIEGQYFHSGNDSVAHATGSHTAERT
jgi:hypothetical protein